MAEQKRNPLVAETTILIILIAAVVLVASYFLLRFAGRWGEADTNAFSTYIRTMLLSGHLVSNVNNYPQGYAYQALVVMLHYTTGLRDVVWQLMGALLIGWLVIPAWLLYRILTSSVSGSALAVVLLFIQPEFLFPTLRGTHEKFTRGLMLLAFFLLVRSLSAREIPRHFIAWLLAFYLVTFALISFNSFLASSAILALALALIASWILMLQQRQHHSSTTFMLRRLAFATIISLALAFLFIFYIYSPAVHEIRVLNTVYDRIASLFLDVQNQSSNPYAYIISGWISLPIYFMVSLANWLLLGVSVVVWFGLTLGWLLKRWQPEDESALLLWAFYGVFAFIGALSILSDITGSLGGNLQLRNFPTFTMFAAPLVAKTWVAWHPRRPRTKRLAGGIAVVVLALLAILSVLKATNEPLLSNKWTFYEPSEMTALDFSERRLTGNSLWVGFDERLITASNIRSTRDISLTGWGGYVFVRDLLTSDVMRTRGLRLGLSLPLKGDELRVYDNGQTQLYHKRPRTPFQR